MRESVWHRSARDTEAFRQSDKFYWGAEVIGGPIVGGLLGYLLTPNDPSDLESFIYPAGGVVAGLAIITSLIRIWFLFRAPYRQRNEAWSLLEQTPGSPESPIEPQSVLFINYQDESRLAVVNQTAYSRPPGEFSHGFFEIDISFFTATEMQVEQVELEVAGDYLPSGWESDRVGYVYTGYVVAFGLVRPVSKGPHQMRLRAYSEGRWWISKPFDVVVK